MAENTLTAQNATSAGLAVTFAAANADGSKFLNPNDERIIVLARNTNAATRTVTAVKQQSSVNAPGFGPLTVADDTEVLAADTGFAVMGPFPAAKFNGADGYCHLTFSAVTGVEIAVVRIARQA